MIVLITNKLIRNKHTDDPKYHLHWSGFVSRLDAHLEHYAIYLYVIVRYNFVFPTMWRCCNYLKEISAGAHRFVGFDISCSSCVYTRNVGITRVQFPINVFVEVDTGGPGIRECPRGAIQIHEIPRRLGWIEFDFVVPTRCPRPRYTLDEASGEEDGGHVSLEKLRPSSLGCAREITSGLNARSAHLEARKRTPEYLWPRHCPPTCHRSNKCLPRDRH